MAEIVAIEVEARLLRWGDSSTAGRTITLELDPDAGERHPFRDYASGAKNGQRFRLLFAPIGDDEEPLKAGPVAEEAPARSLPQTPKGRNPDAADRARQRRREMTPEERMVGDAAMLCEREKFWGWIEQTDPGVVIEGVAEANKWLTDAIGGRKRDIATNPRVREKYRNVETDFKIFAGEMQAPR